MVMNFIIYEQLNKELERTPGAVAVSGIYGRSWQWYFVKLRRFDITLAGCSPAHHSFFTTIISPGSFTLSKYFYFTSLKG